MFHTCVQRFDGMDEKILGGELNRALDFSSHRMHKVLNIDKNKNLLHSLVEIDETYFESS